MPTLSSWRRGHRRVASAEGPETPKGVREDLADLLTRRVGGRTGPDRGLEMRSAFERGPLRDLGVGGSRSPHAGARTPWLDSDGRTRRHDAESAGPAERLKHTARLEAPALRTTIDEGRRERLTSPAQDRRANSRPSRG